MLSYRYGALEVVESGQSQKAINAELKQLDSRLFAELQIDLDQQRVWTVQLDVGDAGPPVPVLDWRDDDGNPIKELTWNVVGEVKRMMAEGPIDNEGIRRKNAALREKRRQEGAAERRELVYEHLKVLRTRGISMAPREREVNHARHREREARLRLSDRATAR